MAEESLGKTGLSGLAWLGDAHLNADGGLEGSQFTLGQGDEEGFEQDDGLAEAGVQVVMRSVDGGP